MADLRFPKLQQISGLSGLWTDLQTRIVPEPHANGLISIVRQTFSDRSAGRLLINCCSPEPAVKHSAQCALQHAELPVARPNRSGLLSKVSKNPLRVAFKT